MLKIGDKDAKGLYYGSSAVVKAFWGSEQVWPSLPYDAEVQWLESTGTQWIDTGVTASSSSHIVVKMSDYSRTGAWMFGARRGYLQNAVGIYSDANAAVNSFRFAWGGYLGVNFTYTTTDVGVVTIDINAGNLTITRNRIPYTYTEQASTQSFTTPVPMYLFMLNNNGSLTNIASMKLYSFMIDGVRDMIPVRFTNEQG